MMDPKKSAAAYQRDYANGVLKGLGEKFVAYHDNILVCDGDVIVNHDDSSDLVRRLTDMNLFGPYIRQVSKPLPDSEKNDSVRKSGS